MSWWEANKHWWNGDEAWWEADKAQCEAEQAAMKGGSKSPYGDREYKPRGSRWKHGEYDNYSKWADKKKEEESWKDCEWWDHSQGWWDYESWDEWDDSQPWDDDNQSWEKGEWDQQSWEKWYDQWHGWQSWDKWYDQQWSDDHQSSDKWDDQQLSDNQESSDKWDDQQWSDNQQWGDNQQWSDNPQECQDIPQFYEQQMPYKPNTRRAQKTDDGPAAKKTKWSGTICPLQPTEPRYIEITSAINEWFQRERPGSLSNNHPHIKTTMCQVVCSWYSRCSMH